MGWPNIPQLIYTDEVKVRTVSWGPHDKAGGRVPTATDWSDGTFPCSVSAASAQQQVQHSREGMLVSHVVTCNDRLGFLRDQLQWQETGAILTITAVEPAGDATGRVWNHYASELPLR